MTVKSSALKRMVNNILANTLRAAFVAVAVKRTATAEGAKV